MKILVLEADYISFNSKKCIKPGFEQQYRDHQEINYTTILFITVEKYDTIEEFKKLDLRITTDSVVIYPFAHLGNNQSNLELAAKIINEVSNLLKAKYVIYRAALGWLKDLKLHADGNKDIHYYDSECEYEGTRTSPSSTIYAFNNGEKWVTNLELEILKTYKQLITYGKNKKSSYSMFLQGAHSGQICLNTRGTKLYKQIYKYVEKQFEDRGYLPVITPHVWARSTYYVKKYYSTFPNRQFRCQENGIFRIASCLGVFKFFKSNHMHLSNLPIGYYQIGPMYRFEQKGQTSSMRLRTFTMTDLHVFTHNKTLEKEIQKCFKMIIDSTRYYLGDNYALIFRYTNEFEHYAHLLSIFPENLIFEQIKTHECYWCMKLEVVQFHDGTIIQLGTLQLDTKNAQNMQLKIYDTTGVSKQNLYILHVSTIGSIQRLIYCIEKSHQNLPVHLCEYKLILFHDKQIANDRRFKSLVKALQKKLVNIKCIQIVIKNISSELSKLKTYDFGYFTVCTSLNITQNKFILKDNTNLTKEVGMKQLLEL